MGRHEISLLIGLQGLVRPRRGKTSAHRQRRQQENHEGQSGHQCAQAQPNVHALLRTGLEFVPSEQTLTNATHKYQSSMIKPIS